jgi:3-oxoacyl-[acyl-carrier-protein] synthase II
MWRAISEAAQVIQRGAAEVMVAGGADSPLHPFQWLRRALIDRMSQSSDPASACRPFDARRDGQVRGEGAAAVVLEERSHAEARGGKIIGRILSWSSCCQPRLNGRATVGVAIERAIRAGLNRANLQPHDIGHINAHGLSTTDEDQVEAAVLRRIFGNTPVTALKSYFGNLGAASGAIELLGSILSFQAGLVPPTLNYESPDPECPVSVVHGRPLAGQKSTALTLNFTPFGQVAAIVVAGASH